MPTFRSNSKRSRHEPCCTMIPKQQRRVRRRQTNTLINAALTVLTFTNTSCAQPDQTLTEHRCQSEQNGWTPSSDCRQYYWCQDGSLLSAPYDCVEGFLYDASSLSCVPEDTVCCNCGMSTRGIDVDSLPSSQTNETSSRQSFGGFGEPIYYPDFATKSCKVRDETSPTWLTTDDLYSTKLECCEKGIQYKDWIPLETCLGSADWVETNIIWLPTKSPTLSPITNGPTESPTASPSSSDPTVAPSMVTTGSPIKTPTYSPSHQPTLYPTFLISNSPSLSPITASPTPPPSEAPLKLMNAELDVASKVQDTCIINPIGWANDGMPASDQEAFSSSVYYGTYSAKDKPSSYYGVYGTSDKPTPSAVSTSIELEIEIANDATISMQRPEANFANHQALAVDGGGGSNGEKFVSLLKFDVSVIDSSRVIESCTLKLYAVEGCEAGGELRTTKNAEWESDTITWDNAPDADGIWIGSLPAITAGKWYDGDVTSALLWHDFQPSTPYISIRIESDKNSRCLYSSMESGESVSPRLVVRYIEQPTAQRIKAFEEPVRPSSATGDFVLLKATDDATVVAGNPSQNFGNEKSLLIAVDSATRGLFDTLIKFDLTELVSTLPRKAVLSLFSETDCSSAGMITTTYSDNWSQDEVTWLTAPIYNSGSPAGGVSLGVFGAVSNNSWVAFNALNAINDALKAGKNSVTFRLSSGDLKPCQFSSRDGGRAPKLMVVF